MAIGKPFVRVEDERFLRGEGRFTADYALPHMVEAHVLRSPYAHAEIRSISTDQALALPGVHAVFTGDDLPSDLPPIQCRIPTHGDLSAYLQFPFARGKVRYVGEPLALIIADTRAIAEDAAELVDVDFEPLTAVTDPSAALTDASAKVHERGNLAGRWGFDLGDVATALDTAAFTASDRFSIQRHSAMPMETRGLLASYDAGRNLLDVYGPTKVVHTNRNMLASMLGMGEAEIRMIEPDVGGSFGARGEFYPEDYLIPFASIRLKR
ncbi:MAG: xanthine dehydrogenase family protein molybdopterin-binding subunit, partial [Rhizobiaceae bacterium]|nr:xanthine dehydrogenase family protein molybdopterin-binding subunit [Rhizobiaceae bacterium]